jgi:hypothetical protein
MCYMSVAENKILTVIKRSTFVFLVGYAFFSLECLGQWGVPFANSWIKYDQNYVKVSVATNGLYRVPVSALPSDFVKADKNYIQVFYRGKEIAVVRADEKEVVFYGVGNDGSSDSLFYRPMSSRLNPYSSLYSDQSAYFLTIGKSPGKRSVKILGNENVQAVSQKYHLANELSVFGTQYSLSTQVIAPDFLNSFFEKGVSRTGERIPLDSLFEVRFGIRDYAQTEGMAPHLRTLVHGMHNHMRTVDIYAGKTKNSIRKLGTLTIEGMVGKIFEADLRPEDFSASGEGAIFFRANGTSIYDRFSVAFQSIVYPQALSLAGLNTKYFEIPASKELNSALDIEGLKTETEIFDVTDADNPKVISRVGPLVIPRISLQKLKLFVTSEIKTVETKSVVPVSFSEIRPSLYDYIIITNELLSESSGKYAAYRSSVEGGSYKVLVVQIKDLYNQFNFGEPSPLGIRRFVDFMISDRNYNRHLFLIGKSITQVEVMQKELDEDVPAVGYPGSDIVTIEGLGGISKDVPVIPVGRLMATSVQDVEVYLEKVKQYERSAIGDIGWRKRILHLSGGHDAGEISQFRQILGSLSPLPQNGLLGANVEAKVKQTFIEVEPVNIASEINAGVGMFTYFGHGSRTKTDLDFGYITDPQRGYSESNKYAFMFFNGCGVGNVFRGLFSANPSSSNRRPLSMDWILTPGKGAIAIMANSSNSYVSPSVNYLRKLYETLFSDNLTTQMSIGNIQKETIVKVIGGSKDFYDIANLHQSVLQGDPALHLFNIEKPDYSLDRDNSIVLYPELAGQTIGSGSSFKVAIVISNLGKYEKASKVPVRIRYSLKNGGSESINMVVNAMPYQDTIYVSYSNANIVQRIEVLLDEANTIPEMSKTNNRSELFIDWSIASTQYKYPTSSVKDNISPDVTVRINNRLASNEGVFAPNPSVQIMLRDNRFLDLDTTLVNVFVKRCWDEACDFTRIPYSTEVLKLEHLDDYTVVFKLTSTNLTEGSYELLVDYRDMVGNKPLAPYSIRFSIADGKEGEFRLICSPNPASEYIKFTSNDYSAESVNSMTLLIFDAGGRQLERKYLRVGDREWYWYPKNAGLLVYKVLFELKNGEGREVSGKVVVLK